MITLLVGHRGSGKTEFLGRVRSYLEKARVPCIAADLDEMIARESGRSISEIFEREGEAAFRDRERATLREFVSRHRDSMAFLSLGAGFEGELPAEARVLWVRRPTDSSVRVFLDRPALAGYAARLAPREARYSAWAHGVWSVPEGMDHPNRIEENFVLDWIGSAREAWDVGGVVTILPENFRGGFDRWVRPRLGWIRTRFELRDDLLSPEQIREARARINGMRIVYSFRKEVPSRHTVEAVHAQGCLWDWPLELGEFPTAEVPIVPPSISLHERADSLFESARRLERAGEGFLFKPWLKLAVEVRSFAELREGFAWAEQDPERRSFLPRSSDGRWAWFRNWTQSRYPLTFFREGDGTSADQPLLADWMRVRPSVRDRAAVPFAAVLGSPVLHSRSPAEHAEFFSTRGMPFFAIDLKREEWGEGFEVLRALGLRAAAVTAPLKDLAFDGNATNTLAWDGSRWQGTNTDRIGIRELSRHAKGSVAVWGGGGTLEAIREALPNAAFYSVRESAPRTGATAIRDPETVVWATTDSKMPEWKPRLVLDLNYSESSSGREFALRAGARYISGLEMFRAQARAQREYWEKGLKS